MENKKVLNEIAMLYNQNSLGKAYYFNNADNKSFMECASACSVLTELLQNMGCKYNKEYTTKKLDSPYGEYWEMQIL